MNCAGVTHERRPEAATPSRSSSSSQQLPPDKRGVSFEALFYRQLQAVTTRIHATENIDEIMLEASQDICKLFNADRLTLYAINEDRSVDRLQGQDRPEHQPRPEAADQRAEHRRLRGACRKQLVNIADVYDDEALKRIHPTLTFLKEVDKRSGYRTKQMLVVPILDGDVLHGVLQVINNKSDQPFGELEIEGATQLCKTLATAIRQRMQRAEDGARRKATKYDGLVADGVLTHDELQTRGAEGARGSQAGRAGADGGLLDPPGADRPVAVQVLRRALRAVQRRAASASRRCRARSSASSSTEQGWIPLEEAPEGLVVMCLDPEAVRNSRIVPQVFPRVSKFA